MMQTGITNEAKFERQMVKVSKAFNRPKTMLEVSIETGILRANITRYVAHWQKTNQITLAYKGYCPKSKCPAGFYVMTSIQERGAI